MSCHFFGHPLGIPPFIPYSKRAAPPPDESCRVAFPPKKKKRNKKAKLNCCRIFKGGKKHDCNMLHAARIRGASLAAIRRLRMAEKKISPRVEGLAGFFPRLPTRALQGRRTTFVRRRTQFLTNPAALDFHSPKKGHKKRTRVPPRHNFFFLAIDEVILEEGNGEWWMA